jgi:hypothetical protein
MGTIGEEGTVPNEATKSEYYYIGGFPNPIALPNRISFNAPINTIINFLYGG